MKGIVLGFAGCIGSGKTTVSGGVAKSLAWPFVSFGDYVRNLARSRGLDDSSRKVLQTLGEMLINEGFEKFCRSVLKEVSWSPGQSLVIDGIRHVEAVEILKTLVSPSKFYLIYVDINEHERVARLRKKGVVRPAEIKAIDLHTTEKDVHSTLPGQADLKVDGTEATNKTIDKIISWVKSQ